MKEKSLYISFGPVQSYVIEARTTRDLWAGSSLLSLLAKVALDAAIATGAEPISPVPPASRSGPAEENNGHASTPNTMQIDCRSIPPKEVALAMTERWKGLWTAVCDVAHRIMKNATDDKLSEYADGVWARQTGQLWHSRWSLGAYESLSARKNLRDFDAEPEPGWKCTVCGRRQAIAQGDSPRATIKALWTTLRESLGNQGVRIGETEKLCAICFIKRVLPVIIKAGEPSELSELDREAFPSTVNFASVTWLRSIIDSDDTTLRAAAVNMYETLKHCSADRAQPLSVIRKRETPGPCVHLLDYNGDYFYKSSYEAGRFENHTTEQTSQLRNALGPLISTCKKAGIPGPSSYYSVLLMDGDDMGKTLSENEDRKREISMALGEFARETYGIVESSEGRVVYAGGDDLLAFLPLETVLGVALRLRSAFTEAMSPFQLSCRAPTISAGITLANMSMPLQQIIMHSHHLLDNVAKQYRGDGQAGHKKDAFAIQVWDRTGPSVMFVKNWDVSNGATWPEELERMVSGARGKTDLPLTGGFLHSASDLIARFEEAELRGEDTLVALLTAEYFGSRMEGVGLLRKTREGIEKAERMMRNLVNLARTDGISTSLGIMYNKDAPLMVRFLAGGGVN